MCKQRYASYSFPIRDCFRITVTRGYRFVSDQKDARTFTSKIKYGVFTNKDRRLK